MQVNWISEKWEEYQQFILCGYHTVDKFLSAELYVDM